MTRHPRPTVADPRGEPEVAWGGIAITYPTMEAAKAAVERAAVERGGEGR